MSLEIRCFIEFDCQIIFVEFDSRTQSTSMHGLSLIEIFFLPAELAEEEGNEVFTH